jgi:hypothetical protein
VTDQASLFPDVTNRGACPACCQPIDWYEAWREWRATCVACHSHFYLPDATCANRQMMVRTLPKGCTWTRVERV